MELDENRPAEDHPAHWHENKDVKARGIVISALILLLMTIAVELLVGVWMGVYSEEEGMTQAQRSPRLADTTGQFPAPVVQGNPSADMAMFLKQENARLAAYGKSADSKTVRIPIERAMDVLAQEGFPTRPDSSN